MSATAAAIFEERVDPGRLSSAVLAAAVHLALLAVLIFGVRWQNRPAEAVSVELWEPPPAPVVEPPKPEPKPEPVVVKPEAPKPEPVVPKPEIVEKKAPPEKPKPVPKPLPKPVPKAEPKPVAKVEPLKHRMDEAKKRMNEELAREQASLAVNQERQQIKDQLAREAASVNARALATWMDKIRLHIRSRINVQIADAVPGNPEAVFNVTLLPSYDVLKIAKQKSSGNKAYDDEVERAILKASPLPRPDRPELFSRELHLTFRPKD
jgi:colicin import membrane protein